MKPSWIRTKWPDTSTFNRVTGLLEKRKVNTVCRSARCPNIGECFSKNHVTFMILGNVCTRKCRFCSVEKGIPQVPDEKEIENIIEIVGLMKMEYVIITSVTRDDLFDGGAGFYADAVNKIKYKYPDIKIEILTPDFFGKSYDNLIEAKPYIWAHNVETVPRLYKEIRPQADYRRSIELLKSVNPVRGRPTDPLRLIEDEARGTATTDLGRSASNGEKIKKNDIFTKSGIMLGLGERQDEVLTVLSDLRGAGVDMITLGQYLKPSRESVDVKKFLNPEEFEWYKNKAINLGFKSVKSAPLVRSSYRE